MSFTSWVGKTFGLDKSAPWLWFYGSSSHSGKAVNLATSLPVAAFYACLRVQSQAVASIPIHTYRKDASGGRTRVEDHPLSEIINGSPNADMTSHEFWEAMTAWICARGNGYAEIARSGDRIVALNLLPSDAVQVGRNESGDLRYRYTDRGKTYELPAEAVFHVRGFGFGGDEGLDPIRCGANVLGAAIAGDEASGKFLGSGLMPSGFLEVDPKLIQELDKTQRKDITDGLKEFVGSNKAGKIASLPPGITFKPVSLDPDTMQLLETRRFSVEQICTFMGVPPVVIGHSAPGVTQWGTGVESIQLQWLSTGLNPLLTRIEKRIKKQLLGPADRGVFCAFNREALMQADSAAKIAFLSGAVQNGLYSRNEARAKLDMPAVEGGDALTVQVNLSPLDKLGAAQDARSQIRNALQIDEQQ